MIRDYQAPLNGLTLRVDVMILWWQRLIHRMNYFLTADLSAINARP